MTKLKSYFNKFYLCKFLSFPPQFPDYLSLVINKVFFLPWTERALYMGIVSPAFRNKKEGQIFFLYLLFLK